MSHKWCQSLNQFLLILPGRMQGNHRRPFKNQVNQDFPSSKGMVQPRFELDSPDQEIISVLGIHCMHSIWLCLLSKQNSKHFYRTQHRSNELKKRGHLESKCNGTTSSMDVKMGRGWAGAWDVRGDGIGWNQLKKPKSLHFHPPITSF